jgi:hypothetical protein
MPNAPDLYVNSTVDHLLDRSVDSEAIRYGADVVHRQLVRWLERCGARKPVSPPSATAEAADR